MTSADAIDLGSSSAGILITCTALGSGLGIAMAVLEEKSLTEIELWGFLGTAVGFLEDPKAPHLSFHFVLLLALTAALTVMVLEIVGAPFWSLYFAGIISAPFILYVLRKHDAERSTAAGERDARGPRNQVS